MERRTSLERFILANLRLSKRSLETILFLICPLDFVVVQECFTRVLKGMLCLSNCFFPPNTVGARLDSFARQSLWNVGLDYPHGTGHGVGCCLNVHEGPQSIGTRIKSETFLVPGMILSDGLFLFLFLF